MTSHIRRFHLHRFVDHSGVSGTGIVAEGTVYTCGWVALSWLSGKHCVNIYEDMDTMLAVHGHDGSTEVVFIDPDVALAS